MSENRAVAEAATTKNEFPLDRLALIGTFGTETGRYALLRHASGRIQKVQMGDRVSGRRVTAISDGVLILTSSSGTKRLDMPQG